ncbi:hypothetical protein [Escherichia coli]|uniref:hypothetical protein n=1 Tax=Escherichia coli TaxID=562 RepID=UPI0032B3F987
MDGNIKGLVSAGHEMASELKAECGAVDVHSVAQLISDLASQLEVQYVRAEESQREFRSADITMQNLEAKCEKLAAENAGLKSAFDNPQAYLSWHAIPPTWEDPLPCGEYLDVHDEAGHKNSDGTDCWPVFAKPEIETPATEAFLAEVRASAIDSLVDIKTKQLTDMHPDTHAFGATAMSIRSQINELQSFAAQLRKGVQL